MQTKGKTLGVIGRQPTDMEESRQDKFKRETAELYQAYGKFAIEFEQMCNSMRICLIFAMHAHGLTEQRLIRIMLADLTADPLIKRLRATVGILYEKRPEDIKYLTPLFKFCIDINEKRNEIIHGTWYIGWTSAEQNEFNTASGMKEKLTKDGLRLDSYNYNPKEFSDLTEKVILANTLINRLHGCISFGSEIQKNIDLNVLKDIKV
jgi:hypothetical protein